MEGKIVHEIWQGMKKVGEKYDLSAIELADYTSYVTGILRLVDKEGDKALELIEDMKKNGVPDND